VRDGGGMSLTDEQARALGARWVAAGGPREMAGARYLTPYGLNRLGDPAYRCSPAEPQHWYRSGNEEADPVGDDWIPDLRDPATRGAALEVLREKWHDPGLHIRYSSQTREWSAVASDSVSCWRRDGDGGLERVTGATEAEALVAALEAAPR
jgi:hypothetical protein